MGIWNVLNGVLVFLSVFVLSTVDANPVNCTAVIQSTVIETSPLSCTFNNGTCGFTLSGQWTRTNTYDYHNVRIASGHKKSAFVVYDRNINTTSSSQSVISSPELKPGTYCLSFWIYTTNIFEGLDIRTSNGQNVTAEIKGTLNSGWIEHIAAVNETQPFKIEFQYVKKPSLIPLLGKYETTGMDDILIVQTSGVGKNDTMITCSPGTGTTTNGTCNFNSDECGYTIQGHFETKTGLFAYGGNVIPHGHDNSPYIVCNWGKIRASNNNTLTSPLIEPGTYCLTFWYYVTGTSVGLSVFTSTGKTLFANISDNENTHAWTQVSVSISEKKPFQVLFQMLRATGFFSSLQTIGLDDIRLASIKTAACTKKVLEGTCTFTGKQSCSFTFKQEGRWKSVEGQFALFARPVISSGQDDRFYAIFESFPHLQNETEGQSYDITSPVLDPGRYCLSFWYNMPNHYSNLTVVIQTTDQLLNTLWTFQNSQKSWTEESLHLQETKHFQILFRSIHISKYKGAFVGLDNIKLTKEPGTFTTLPTTQSTSNPTTITSTILPTTKTATRKTTEVPLTTTTSAKIATTTLPTTLTVKTTMQTKAKTTTTKTTKITTVLLKTTAKATLTTTLPTTTKATTTQPTTTNSTPTLSTTKSKTTTKATIQPKTTVPKTTLPKTPKATRTLPPRSTSLVTPTLPATMVSTTAFPKTKATTILPHTKTTHLITHPTTRISTTFPTTTTTTSITTTTLQTTKSSKPPQKPTTVPTTTTTTSLLTSTVSSTSTLPTTTHRNTKPSPETIIMTTSTLKTDKTTAKSTGKPTTHKRKITKAPTSSTTLSTTFLTTKRKTKSPKKTQPTKEVSKTTTKSKSPLPTTKLTTKGMSTQTLMTLKTSTSTPTTLITSGSTSASIFSPSVTISSTSGKTTTNITTSKMPISFSPTITEYSTTTTSVTPPFTSIKTSETSVTPEFSETTSSLPADGSSTRSSALVTSTENISTYPSSISTPMHDTSVVTTDETSNPVPSIVGSTIQPTGIRNSSLPFSRTVHGNTAGSPNTANSRKSTRIVNTSTRKVISTASPGAATTNATDIGINSNQNGDDSNTGVIVGAVVGAIVAVGLVLVVLLLYIKMRHKRLNNGSPVMDDNTEATFDKTKRSSNNLGLQPIGGQPLNPEYAAMNMQPDNGNVDSVRDSNRSFENVVYGYD